MNAMRNPAIKPERDRALVHALGTRLGYDLAAEVDDDAKPLTKVVDDLVERAYRAAELAYRVEDARHHLGDRELTDVDEETVEQIAELFIADYDCNLSENDQWDLAIDHVLDGGK